MALAHATNHHDDSIIHFSHPLLFTCLNIFDYECLIVAKCCLVSPLNLQYYYEFNIDHVCVIHYEFNIDHVCVIHYEFNIDHVCVIHSMCKMQPLKTHNLLLKCRNVIISLCNQTEYTRWSRSCLQYCKAVCINTCVTLYCSYTCLHVLKQYHTKGMCT